MQHQRLMRSTRKEPAKTPSSASLQTMPDMQTDSTTQASVEPRLGHDFGRIPLHAAPAGAFQAKLALSQPGDVYEQEADQVADEMMGNNKPEPALADERDEADPFLARKPRTEAGGAAAAAGSSSLIQPALSGGGQPLDAETQAFMEPRFGHDFSKVRIHADERAAESARSVNALAYTVGQDIVFGEGQYAPGTSAGKHLLAHELTHTLQQRPAEAGNQEAETEPMQVTPGPLVQRQVDIAAPDSTEQSTSETSKPVSEMTSMEKLIEACKRAPAHFGSAVWTQIKNAFTLTNLAIAVGFALLVIGASALFPPLALALELLMTIYFVHVSLLEIEQHLSKFYEARNATTPEELDKAGEELANAVAVFGVSALLIFLPRMLKLGVRFFKRPPTELPPEPPKTQPPAPKIPKEEPPAPEIPKEEQPPESPPAQHPEAAEGVDTADPTNPKSQPPESLPAQHPEGAETELPSESAPAQRAGGVEKGGLPEPPKDIFINIFKGDGTKLAGKITDLEGDKAFQSLDPALQDVIKQTRQIMSNSAKRLNELTDQALNKGDKSLREAVDGYDELGPWTRKYLQRITRDPRPRTWQAAYGYAVEEMSRSEMIDQGLNREFNLEFNQRAPEGLNWLSKETKRTARPDIRMDLNSGKWNLLDWTSVKESGKIVTKYTSNEVEYLIEFLHTPPILP